MLNWLEQSFNQNWPINKRLIGFTIIDWSVLIDRWFKPLSYLSVAFNVTGKFFIASFPEKIFELLL